MSEMYLDSRIFSENNNPNISEYNLVKPDRPSS